MSHTWVGSQDVTEDASHAKSVRRKTKANKITFYEQSQHFLHLIDREVEAVSNETPRACGAAAREMRGVETERDRHANEPVPNLDRVPNTTAQT